MENLEAQHNSLPVEDLQSTSLEYLVKSKLSLIFEQQKQADVELNGLHKIIIEQVEKPLIELALGQSRGNQVRAAKLLGINRNTLRKKIDAYRIEIRKTH